MAGSNIDNSLIMTSSAKSFLIVLAQKLLRPQGQLFDGRCGRFVRGPGKSIGRCGSTIPNVDQRASRRFWFAALRCRISNGGSDSGHKQRYNVWGDGLQEV